MFGGAKSPSHPGAGPDQPPQTGKCAALPLRPSGRNDTSVSFFSPSLLQILVCLPRLMNRQSLEKIIHIIGIKNIKCPLLIKSLLPDA
ncbi:hypothetical protein HUJ05_003104 [Dendroctonus ponderosae]|nr:hypothetical protein HUJ05_003104 [Dendroctonus ponderosae]